VHHASLYPILWWMVCTILTYTVSKIIASKIRRYVADLDFCQRNFVWSQHTTLSQLNLLITLVMDKPEIEIHVPVLLHDHFFVSSSGESGDKFSDGMFWSPGTALSNGDRFISSGTAVATCIDDEIVGKLEVVLHARIHELRRCGDLDWLLRLRFAEFRAALSSFRYSPTLYSTLANTSSSSLTSTHKPLSFHSRNRPPSSLTSLTTSSTMGFRLTLVRFRCADCNSLCFISIKLSRMALPGWPDEVLPCRNMTSLTSGHSITSTCPFSISSRTFNHSRKYGLLFLMFPSRVLGISSAGIPKVCTLYFNSVGDPAAR